MKEGTNDQTTIQNVGLQVITCRLCIILPGLIYHPCLIHNIDEILFRTIVTDQLKLEL